MLTLSLSQAPHVLEKHPKDHCKNILNCLYLQGPVLVTLIHSFIHPPIHPSFHSIFPIVFHPFTYLLSQQILTGQLLNNRHYVRDLSENQTDVAPVLTEWERHCSSNHMNKDLISDDIGRVQGGITVD